MKIRNEVNFDNKKEYEIGDLFEIEVQGWTGSTEIFVYTLIGIYDKYYLVRFNDRDKVYHTYNGEHSSIEDLFNDFDDEANIIAHYPSDEYELILTKKQEEII